MKNTELYEVLFEAVSSIIEMTDHDKSLCLRYFEPAKLPKNTIVEAAKKTPQHQYFIASGIMRNYHYNELGEAVTTDMNYSPRFFTSYINFMHRNPSDEIIECVTDCELLRIRRDDVDILYTESIILKDFTILYLEKVFEEERARVTEMATFTAEQRYIKLMEKAPNILLAVPLQHIASYLGMKPETLSRIRRKSIS